MTLGKKMKNLATIGIAFLCAVAHPRAELVLLEIEISGYAEGLRFSFSVGDVVRRTPAWKASEEYPPLSPRRAETLATKKLKDLLNDPEKWSRGKIILTDSGDNIHWYYVVEFENHIGEGTQPPKMRIVVLMDGTIPEPLSARYP